MKHISGLLLLFWCLGSVLQAEVRRLCAVASLTDQRWTRPVIREITFVNGMELTRPVRKLARNQFGNFALLWFAQDQVAIVEPRGLALVHASTVACAYCVPCLTLLLSVGGPKFQYC
jgi:hypothetical protein